MFRNKAFTLAEVLITLVIIGVIAAITVPSIMQVSKKNEYSARLKKFYGVLNQASTRAYAIGDSWDIWCEDADNKYDTTTKSVQEFLTTYLLPHLSTLKTGVENKKYMVYLADGTTFYMTKEQCLHFFYDVNGKQNPNVMGRDQFRYTYCPLSIDSRVDIQPGVLVAYNWNTGKTRTEALNACKRLPDTCSKLLLMDNWEFKKDYPWPI